MSPDVGVLSAPLVADVVVEQPTAIDPPVPASTSAAAVSVDRKKRVLPDNKRTAYVSSRGSSIVAPKGLASRMVTRRVPAAAVLRQLGKSMKVRWKKVLREARPIGRP